MGLKRRGVSTSWSLSAYRSEVDDLVAFDVATFRPQNVAQARLAGAEGRIDWRDGPWRLEQTLAWLSAEDRSGGASAGRELPRRPQWSGRSSIAWSENAWNWGASVQFVGRRYDDLANTRALGGYTVVDLTAGWQVGSMELQVRLANALDRRYETASLYPALGREVFVTLRHRAPR